MQTATVEKEINLPHRIPETMQAAIYRGVNDVRVETVPVPPIGPGEVLLRVATCGVCGTDLKKIHTGSHSAPRIFGHETAGVIAAVGEGVHDFQIRDRVSVFHHVPCGACYYCRKRLSPNVRLISTWGVRRVSNRPAADSLSTYESWIGLCVTA